jgi:hypothetical protein
MRILRGKLKDSFYAKIGTANEQQHEKCNIQSISTELCCSFHIYIYIFIYLFISCCKNRVNVSGKELQTGGTAGPNGITMEEIKKTEKSLLVRKLPFFFYFGFSP